MSLDTRKAFRDLRASGADESLADAIVDLVRQASDLPDIGLLATKDDVALTKAEIRADIAEFKAGLEVKMARQETRIFALIAASTAISAFANGGFQFLTKILHID